MTTFRAHSKRSASTTSESNSVCSTSTGMSAFKHLEEWQQQQQDETNSVSTTSLTTKVQGQLKDLNKELTRIEDGIRQIESLKSPAERDGVNTNHVARQDAKSTSHATGGAIPLSTKEEEEEAWVSVENAGKEKEEAVSVTKNASATPQEQTQLPNSSPRSSFSDSSLGLASRGDNKSAEKALKQAVPAAVVTPSSEAPEEETSRWNFFSRRSSKSSTNSKSNKDLAEQVSRDMAVSRDLAAQAVEDDSSITSTEDNIMPSHLRALMQMSQTADSSVFFATSEEDESSDQSCSRLAEKRGVSPHVVSALTQLGIVQGENQSSPRSVTEEKSLEQVGDDKEKQTETNERVNDGQLLGIETPELDAESQNQAAVLETTNDADSPKEEDNAEAPNEDDAKPTNLNMMITESMPNEKHPPQGDSPQNIDPIDADRPTNNDLSEVPPDEKEVDKSMNTDTPSTSLPDGSSTSKDKLKKSLTTEATTRRRSSRRLDSVAARRRSNSLHGRPPSRSVDSGDMEPPRTRRSRTCSPIRQRQYNQDGIMSATVGNVGPDNDATKSTPVVLPTQSTLHVLPPRSVPRQDSQVKAAAIRELQRQKRRQEMEFMKTRGMEHSTPQSMHVRGDPALQRFLALAQQDSQHKREKLRALKGGLAIDAALSPSVFAARRPSASQLSVSDHPRTNARANLHQLFEWDNLCKLMEANTKKSTRKMAVHRSTEKKDESGDWSTISTKGSDSNKKMRRRRRSTRRHSEHDKKTKKGDRRKKSQIAHSESHRARSSGDRRRKSRRAQSESHRARSVAIHGMRSKKTNNILGLGDFLDQDRARATRGSMQDIIERSVASGNLNVSQRRRKQSRSVAEPKATSSTSLHRFTEKYKALQRAQLRNVDPGLERSMATPAWPDKAYFDSISLVSSDNLGSAAAPHR